MADDRANDAEMSELPVKKPGASKGIIPPKVTAPTTPGVGAHGGFFTIYKKGQGYWTRMGTVISATLIALLMAQFLYVRGKVWFTSETVIQGVQTVRPNMPLVLGVVAAFLAVFAGVVYYFVNKPTVVDFLIATDSEMKKVNWTTRAELIGSTKVVIIFMLLVAVLLFGLDTFFGELFYLLRILQFGPFG